ncbi:response regulator [bacterium]|nr:response regulator [bacterium]
MAKPLILYVDDDPDYREVVGAILRSNGYEMAGAGSGEKGLQIYKERRPDLVIVDLMMEEVDAGTRFVKELRLLGDDVPIYLLSSVGETLGLSTDQAALGLAGILQKPIDRETLLALLKVKLGV